VDGAAKEAEVEMALLKAASGDEGEERAAFGAPGTGVGTDVLGELERVRSNLAALAEVVEGIRGKLNAHVHGGAVAALPAGEQEVTAYTMH
jgi:hypothetical protein